jgi:hypothetical protein
MERERDSRMHAQAVVDDILGLLTKLHCHYHLRWVSVSPTPLTATNGQRYEDGPTKFEQI